MEAAEGNEIALEDVLKHIIKRSLKFIRARRGLELCDFVQEIEIALVRAVELYNPDRGNFWPYARVWVIGCVNRYSDTNGNPIDLPVETQINLRRLHRAAQAFQNTHGSELPTDAAARAARLTDEEVKNALEISKLKFAVPLDKVVAERGEPLGHLIPQHYPQPEAEAEQRILAGIVRSKLSRLTQRQKEVIALLFGLIDGIERSLIEVSLILGISRQSVYEIRILALRRLKALCSDLADYL